MIEGSENYWRWRFSRVHGSNKITYDKIDEYHPKRGWTLKKNIKDKLHVATTVNSNSEGVRGKNNKYSGKKVLFYGDSFCFGDGVDDDETVSAYFEKNFKNISCLNLGIHGYGIDQQYLYLKETISKYSPSLVCFVITDNDFRRNLMDFRDSPKPKFIIDKGDLKLTNVPVPLNKPSSYPTYKLPFEFLKEAFVFYGILNRGKNIKHATLILDKIRKETEKAGSKLVFVNINEVRRGFWYRHFINSFLKRYFKKNNLLYLTLNNISKNPTELYDSLSGHLSATGNKIVANKLSEGVRARNLLK